MNAFGKKRISWCAFTLIVAVAASHWVESVAANESPSLPTLAIHDLVAGKGTDSALAVLATSQIREELTKIDRILLVEVAQTNRLSGEVAKSHTRDFDPSKSIDATRTAKADFSCTGLVIAELVKEKPSSMSSNEANNPKGSKPAPEPDRWSGQVTIALVLRDASGAVIDSSSRSEKSFGVTQAGSALLFRDSAVLAARNMAAWVANQFEIEGRIIEDSDPKMCVINRGSRLGVETGQRYLVVRVLPADITGYVRRVEVGEIEIDATADEVSNAIIKKRKGDWRPQAGDLITLKEQKTKGKSFGDYMRELAGATQIGLARNGLLPDTVSTSDKKPKKGK